MTLDDIYPHKKAFHREPFHTVLGRLGCAPEQAVMVEDSPGNLRIAKALGLTTVLVRPRPDQPADAAIDHIFATPDAFLDYFVAIRHPGERVPA